MRMHLAVPILFAGSFSTAFAAYGQIGQLRQVHTVSTFAPLSPEETAQNFLAAHSQELHIDPASLELVRQQESLTAYHLVYQQLSNGIPIDTAGITLSISKSTQAIYQYFTAIIPHPTATVFKENISIEQAYDAAWAYVGVSGGIYQDPKAELKYKQLVRGLTLVYSIDLSPTAPYGSWQVDVDAATGKVVNVRDLRINEKKIPIPPTFGTHQPTSNRTEAFSKYQKKAGQLEDITELKNGNARVFDPDPKTELGLSTLVDTSAASAFDNAYVQRTLLDINFAKGVYTLKGPWVQIIDFDLPTDAPTSTPDGNWNFSRGNEGFNEAMTYFHLDQSQRYIQSLGFKGSTGIQFRSIEADADGANGDDNSYFQPSTGRLAYGHGCVDDNEDADVILHEYGHAINASINPNWEGGDTGAMGEGFGDYWAMSYSFSTPKGHDREPQKVYNWDAGNCWPGRSADATAEKYSASASYGAHETLTSGRQSDELWSTPLFQSHMELRAQGVPREEIDTVVLEAQFGLGSGLTMRDMAKSIVATAKRLYPDGPIAQVFNDKFVGHGILVEPTVVLTAALSAVTDVDGVVDPGETVGFALVVSNTGDTEALGVTAVLTSTDPYITALTGKLTLGDIAAGAKATSKITLAVDPNTPCGKILSFQASFKNDAGKTWTIPFAVQVGKSVEVATTRTPNLAIPDKNTQGISDVIHITRTANVSSTFSVDLSINHTYIGDLKVSLVSPSGKTIVLHNKTGSSTDNILGTYPTTLTPKDSFTQLVGDALEGAWTLKVQDTSASDIGTLISWGIRDVSGYECH